MEILNNLKTNIKLTASFMILGAVAMLIAVIGFVSMNSINKNTSSMYTDKLIPVDLYLPGCPPRPEAIFDAVIKLRKKVGNEALAERGKRLPTHRYTTISHQLKAVAPIVDGRYLRAETQQAAFVAAAGLPLGTAQTAEQDRLETTTGSTADGGSI